MSAFQNYFVDTIKERYAQFDGRASRSEYWYFQLFYYILIFGLSFISPLLANLSKGLAFVPTTILIILALGLFIPALALSVRRLHDSDKSGWLLLIGIIPLIGSIILLVFFCLDSTPGKNQYGPNPYDVDGISGSQSFNDIIDR